jgi:hypothetical protein
MHPDRIVIGSESKKAIEISERGIPGIKVK